MRTRDKVLIGIWLFCLGIIPGLYLGRIGYINKGDLIYPLKSNTRNTEVYLNVCDPPYNAIPNDTLPDDDAFRLAIDVLSSIRIEPRLFDSTMMYLKIPQGHYILTKSLDFKDRRLEYEQPTIFGVYGKNNTIANMKFNIR